MALDRTVRWMPWAGTGLEHLRVEGRPGWKIQTHAVVAGEADGTPFALSYYLDLAADWSFVRLFVALVDHDFTTIILHRRPDRVWEDLGRPEGRRELPELAECVDIDLGFTPFTNTLPIRRLNLGAGEARDIKVAHLAPPDFRPKVALQRYTCIEPMRRYRYEDTTFGFSAELEVDEDGIVCDYPGLFRRVAG